MKKLILTDTRRRGPLFTSEAGPYSGVRRVVLDGGKGPAVRGYAAGTTGVLRGGKKKLNLLTLKNRGLGASARGADAVQSVKSQTPKIPRLKLRVYRLTAKDLDFRILAEETLSEVKNVDDSTAVAILASYFKTVSAAAKPATTNMRQPRSRTDDAVDDPLVAARARGRRYALDQYESPDNLALLEARDYAGRNERAINELRQSGQLYALLPPGKTRGFRYPKWQFDASADRLKAVLVPFTEANANCWVIHSFMTRKRDALGGLSPAEVVLDEGEDIERVIKLAQDDLAGEQGAQ